MQGEGIVSRDLWALRSLVWVRLMNRIHFLGLTAPTPPHAIHAAAPKGRTGGGSVTELVSPITIPIFSPPTKQQGGNLWDSHQEGPRIWKTTGSYLSGKSPDHIYLENRKDHAPGVFRYKIPVSNPWDHIPDIFLYTPRSSIDFTIPCHGNLTPSPNPGIFDEERVSLPDRVCR